MKAEELLQAGRLDDTLRKLQDEVRNNPADAKLRVFLFQLLCVLNQWERALTQLQVLAGLDSSSMMLARIFQPVIQCEVLRQEVFAGKRTPILFGEPMEWLGWLSRANELLAQGQFQAARALRDQAFENAPASGGSINDRPFEWIADADQRMGPVLEVIMEGHYYWIPFCRIQRMVIEKPSDLRDMVWTPVQFVWANGGEASGHIPTRYSGSASSPDEAIRLARKTEWVQPAEGFSIGLGQRVLATDQADFPIQECRIIDFRSADSAGPAAVSAP